VIQKNAQRSLIGIRVVSDLLLKDSERIEMPFRFCRPSAVAARVITASAARCTCFPIEGNSVPVKALPYAACFALFLFGWNYLSGAARCPRKRRTRRLRSRIGVAVARGADGDAAFKEKRFDGDARAPAAAPPPQSSAAESASASRQSGDMSFAATPPAPTTGP
jgi:hypothetical protein